MSLKGPKIQPYNTHCVTLTEKHGNFDYGEKYLNKETGWINFLNKFRINVS